MLYDAFLFNDEVELLHLRLIELSGVADRHVLAEATVTLQGRPKPLYYREHAAGCRECAPYADRITALVVDDLPTGDADHFRRESLQREALWRGLGDAEPEDWLLLCDVDELPRPSSLGVAQGLAAPVAILQLTDYRYWLNCRAGDWYGPRLCRVRDVPEHSLQRLREQPPRRVLCHAGWHFSYQGGVERIAAKLAAFAHANYDTPEIRAWLARCVAEGRDLYDPDTLYEFVAIDRRWPMGVVGDLPRWKEWIRW